MCLQNKLTKAGWAEDPGIRAVMNSREEGWAYMWRFQKSKTTAVLINFSVAKAILSLTSPDVNCFLIFRHSKCFETTVSRMPMPTLLN